MQCLGLSLKLLHYNGKLNKEFKVIVNMKIINVVVVRPMDRFSVSKFSSFTK